MHGCHCRWSTFPFTELLAQLYVFCKIDLGRTDTLHLMILVAHCVANGLASIMFVQGFLDTLTRSESEPPQILPEDRLVMIITLMDHEPQHLCLFSWAI